MVNKEMLGQLRSMKAETAFYERQLCRLDRELRMYARGCEENPLIAQRKSVLIERARQLQEYYLQSQSVYGRIIGELLLFISSIPNSLTRRVFIQRYIEGDSWQQVSMRLGGEHSADALRMRHDHYLRRVGAQGTGGVAHGKD